MPRPSDVRPTFDRSPTRENLHPGDVVDFYVWAGTEGSVDRNELVFGKVVRANRVTVTIDTENDVRIRKPYGDISSKVPPHYWSPWNRDGI